MIISNIIYYVQEDPNDYEILKNVVKSFVPKVAYDDIRRIEVLTTILSRESSIKLLLLLPKSVNFTSDCLSYMSSLKPFMVDFIKDMKELGK